MTPPEDQGARSLDPKCQPVPAVSHLVRRRAAAFAPGLLSLQHRPDFLRCATGRKQGTGGFLLQARARDNVDFPRAAERPGDFQHGAV